MQCVEVFSVINVKLNKKYILLLLFILSIVIHFFAQNEIRVESHYSNYVFPIISRCLRLVSGCIPFSIGDIFYSILCCWVIWIVLDFCKRIIIFSSLKIAFKQSLFRTVVMILTIYIVFNLLWGINYNRQGIAYQLHLKSGEYDSTQLVAINQLLLEKVNATKDSVISRKMSAMDNKTLFHEAIKAYQSASKKFPFINYEYPSIKSSLWGGLGNYLGYSGYYNPFTGEAQVNTTVPGFLRSYIVCHEIAHQLGYAKENEANFVGYLAAKNSDSYEVQYSAYLDLFMYANRTLYILDSASSIRLRKQLSMQVKKDITTWKIFIESHENFIEPLITKLYGIFLKSNKQPMGILTYDEVTALLVHYYEKTGEL